MSDESTQTPVDAAKYTRGTAVKSMIMLNVDTRYIETTATHAAAFDCVDDVFLVTGDVDIVIRASFDAYPSLKAFIMEQLGTLPGVKESRTSMIVTTYKENGTLMDDVD